MVQFGLGSHRGNEEGTHEWGFSPAQEPKVGISWILDEQRSQACGPPALLELHFLREKQTADFWTPQRAGRHHCRGNQAFGKTDVSLWPGQTAPGAWESGPGRHDYPKNQSRRVQWFQAGALGPHFRGPAVWSWECYLNSFFLYQCPHL